MKLEGLSDYQCIIADLMWNTDSRKEVDTLIEAFGVDAWIVYHMIIAESLDSYDDVEYSSEYLKRFAL
jgi:hypothetical protein